MAYTKQSLSGDFANEWVRYRAGIDRLLQVIEKRQEQVARTVIHEMAIRTGEEQGIDRQTAERVAADITV